MDEKLAQEMAEYIQLTDGIMADQKATIEKQAAELQAQKEASTDETVVLEKSAVEQTVDNCIAAGFIKEAERDQAIKVVTDDPAELLGFLDKLSAQTVESRKAVPALGQAVGEQKVAAGTEPVRESDQIFEAAFDTPVRR